MKRPLVRFVHALALVSSIGFSAHADDLRSYPYPCVEHIHRVGSGLDAHVLVIDLACGEVEVLASRPEQRQDTVSRFARDHHVQIAINANFFESSTCGLAMGEGVVWSDAYRDRCAASVAFGWGTVGTRTACFRSLDNTRVCPVSWARHVVTGWPTLLRDGVIVFDPEDPLGMYRTHPRTALGLTPGGANLVLAVIDGRRSGTPGVTSLEMIPLLEEFGVSDAINLDGGGSSALYIESEGGLVNRPSDRRERPVVNHLGIRITTARAAQWAHP